MKEKLITLVRATTNKNKLPLRVLLAAIGVFIMGFGMSVLEKLNFGTDPYTCMNNGISLASGGVISLGTAGLLVSALMLIFVIVFDISSLGLGTVFNMVGFGYSIDLFRFIWKKIGFVSVDGTMRYVLLAVMLVIFILAVSVYLAADLGSAPYDALPVIISQKTKLPFVAVRMCWDIAAVVIGFLLGSAVGVTTLVCAFLVGPAAGAVRRAVDKILG
ncbi:MAG: hypothetical protein E7598_05375 [Ruminococcaceae bacterium]|nr:hypothetical protein [Oscillospiraceae bacterium]